MRRVSGLLASSASIAGLAAVLAVLGTLQYRWLAQVGAAERERLGRDAQRRAEALAQDLDREITRAYMMLQVRRDPRAGTPSALFAERWDRWTARAPHVGMVAAVYLVEAPPEAAAVVSRFDPARRAFVPAEWPEALGDLGRRLDAARSGEPPPMPIVPDVPALVSPVPDVLEIADDTPPSGPTAFKRVLLTRNDKRVRPHRGTGHWPMWGYVVVALDRAYLTGRMLPQLAARHLQGDDDREYDVTVVDGAARVVWASAAPRASGDAAAPALQVRFDDLERSLLDLEGERGQDHFRFRLAAGVVTSRTAGGDTIPTGWRVVLAHRAGSVDALAARLRRRNLAVSFGVLGVLGAAMALVVVSSQRARALAAREMEFVAGVSHELRTPVAVIRSAAENLADGVVADPEQVRRYGGVILDQGARLTGMVEQVLALAGAQARARAPRTIAPADLVRSAVDTQGEAGAPAAPPQLELDDDLPEIAGDPEALRRAVANLLANARRHGQGSPLRVRARRGARGGVDIEVEDRGPGIEPGDLPHVFEPFYRGRRALADQVPGTGLGLAVVRGVMEAHGGRVSVRSRPGDGATFTLHLPAHPSR